jgi:hypothetical protein
MRVTVKNSDRIRLITQYIDQLSDIEQAALLEGLRKQALLSKARQLDKSVQKNTITMQDIIKEAQKS